MSDFDEYEYLEKAVEKTDDDGGDDANGDAGKVEDGHKSSKRRGNEEEQEHRSKRSRGDEHRSSRREDRDRDRGDRDRHRDDRDRIRERDRGREERERGGEKDKGRERGDRDKARERRDRDREGGRDKDRDRAKDKDRDGEHDKLKEKERRHSRERRDREKEEAAAEPEADPERDQRTVFAYQINLKADERDVYEFFSRAGKVRDVRLIMDRNSRRSKGVGYVEFYDVMSVPMAIALSGQLLLGQPVMVKPSEAEKNLVQSTTMPMMPGMPGLGTTGIFMGPYSGGARRLYVGNLHLSMTEMELRQVFEPFGPVELVQLPLDPDTKQCKGFGFVQYARLEDARAAQQNLNGLELAGRPIKVTAVSEEAPLPDAGPPVNPGELDDDEGGGLSLNARSRADLMLKLDRSGTTGSLAASTASAVPLPPPTLPGGSGLSMLMPGLAGIPGLSGLLRPPNLGGFPGLSGLSILGLPGMGMPGAGSMPGGSPGALGTVPGEVVGIPSECLLLKNMFDEDSEKGPDFELDIKEDVQDECSKFGSVKHIYVDGKSAGHVYVKFDSVTSAQTAQRALHGRWFAGKTISATYMTPLAYKTKFPES